MRKNWKRLSALLLALVMVLSLVPVTALAARVEDDAVEIAAPETAVHEAKPAGAVDAEDVPAVLAEGEDDNIAQGKTIHAYNKNGEEDAEGTTRSATYMVDGTASDASRWASAEDMKEGGANGAAHVNPKTVILDFGENMYATDVTEIKIVWHAKVWAKNYTISTAADEDAGDWTTVYTCSRNDEDNGSVTDSITGTNTLQRFVKFYFEDINLSAAGKGLSIQEIEIHGTLKKLESPTEGIYAIVSENYYLHNSDRTDQCGANNVTSVSTDTVLASSCADKHLWKIAATTDGKYTIQGVAAGQQGYLTATTTTGSNYTQLQLGSSPVEVSIVSAGDNDNSYHISYVDGEATKYFKFNTAETNSTDRGWRFAEVAEGDEKPTVYLSKVSVPILGFGDSSMDYPLTANRVSVSSWSGKASGDGGAAFAIDGIDSNHWHWYYSGCDGGGTTSNATGSNDDAWFKFVLPEAIPVIGVRYRPRQSSNQVRHTIADWKIQTSDDGTTWKDQKTGTFSGNTGNSAPWRLALLDRAVTTKYIRIVSTSSAVTMPTASDMFLVMGNSDSVHQATGTVKSASDSSTLGDVAITLNCRKFTTDSDGAFALNLPNGTYTATLTKTGYMTKEVEVTVNGADVELGDVLLSEPAPAVTGKVTTDGTAALEGAKVELVNSSYAFLTGDANPTATTNGDGTFEALSVNGLGNGTYYLRVSKDGYGAKIINDCPITVSNNSVTNNAEINATLPEIDTSSVNYLYDMTDEDGHRPTLGRVSKSGATNASDNDDAFVNLDWTAESKMKLTFEGRGSDDDGSALRMNRLVKLLGTNVMNGTIEFDAMREEVNPDSPALAGRFGLALRLADSSNWIFVGQWNQNDHWAREYWSGTANVWSSATDVNGQTINFGSDGVAGPSFAPGDTRHFKVTLDGTALKLEIDGITVFNAGNINNGSNAAPTAAADVGFICGNGMGTTGNEDYGVPTSVTIDNLYITRNDPSAAITLTQPSIEGATVTLSAKRHTSAGNGPLVNVGGGKTGAFAGDPIYISASGVPTTHVLDGLAITKADGTALTEAEEGALGIGSGVDENDNPYFSFEMPNYAINVRGKVLPKLTSVEITGTEKVGQKLTANVAPGDAEGKVTYQWQHQDGSTWQNCDSGTGKSTTLTNTDRTKKVKVIVTGDGENYASTVSVEAETSAVIAAADVETASVTIERDTITMWKNLTTDPVQSDNTVMGDTVQLTATVDPENATNKTITWTTSNDQVATVDQTGEVTAVGNGKAIVKAEVTSANGTKVSDTVEITVKTGITSITLTKGGQPIGADPIVIYANASDTGRTVDVTAAVDKDTDATAEVLNWSCGHSEAGYAHIFQLGAANDPSAATGGTVTIAAYGSHTLVGTETVTVSAPAGAWNTAAPVTFTVKVIHKIDSDVTAHNVSITGYDGDAPQVGDELSVSLTALEMSNDDKENLTYQWKRNGTAIQDATNSTYTLVAGDVGATITVTVTATPTDTFFYTGELTSDATPTVVKADGPEKPSLTSTPYSVDVNNNVTKGTITIVSPVAGETYEYRQKTSDADASEETWGDWTTDNLANGVISNLDAGDYQVRVQENDVHLAGVAEAVTVSDTSKTYLDVAAPVVTPAAGGSAVRGSEKVEQGKSVTLTVKPNAGYQIESVKNGDDDVTTVADGADGAKVYTVSNVQADVAFKVTFTKIKVKITHSLSEGLSCSLTQHDEDGNHVVNYGEVTSITLNATVGYNLPSTISVKAGTTDLMAAATDPVTYNNTTGVITFPKGVTQNITITATAAKKTFTVTFKPLINSHLTTAASPTPPVSYGDTLTVTLTPADDGYSVPAQADVRVTMGGNEATFTYAVNETTGVATITVASVTGNVEITASGVKNTTPITAAQINGTPTEGNTLSITGVAPAGATYSVSWQKAETADGTYTQIATTDTYKLVASDVGKYIKAVVSGTGDYSGTKTTAAVGPVAAKVVEAESVTVAAPAASNNTVAMGSTLQLTASILPEDTTETTVKWSVTNGSDVASVSATGVVTPKKAGAATIQAQVIKATDAEGTASGVSNTIVITVTAPVGMTLTGTPKAGETLTANVTPADAAYTIKWECVKDGETTTVATSGTTYTPTANDVGGTIKVTVTGTGNYTGTVEKTSGTILAADAEITAHDVTVAATTNGTVTADPTSATVGTTIALTVTPDEGYKLDTLTVTGTSGGAVTVAEDNTFVMPGEAVTVSATFVEDGGEPPVVVDATALEEAIDAAKAAKKTAVALPNGTEANAVEAGTKFVTESEMGTLDDAIAAAEAALAKADKTEESVADAVTALNNAVSAFEDAVKPGTKTPVVTTALDDAIAAAEAKKSTTVASSANQVASGRPFVTQDVMDALTSAIDTAKTAKNDPLKTEDSVADAVTALNNAVSAFEEAVQTGTKQSSSSSSRPSSSTVTNPDGSVTTTTTKPDGTKVETTEKPDGTKETVETKKDGTVIETTEKPDGTTESVKTQPDGTVVETVVAPDGTKESVMTQPDGTVTETVIDTEGAMTEKVTDPEENVTITVTDPEGEELAKVEIPAEIAEPETKFDDAVDHWAEESINKIAALGLVNGVGDNKYGTESSLTRGQLATVLYRLSNGKSGYRVSFSDVELGQYYTEGVAWAAKAKVVNGYTADIFAPDDVITREQLAVMLCRYAKLIGLNTNAKAESLNAFGDGASTSAWAVDGVAWCVENGILKGMGNDVLSPTANVTRAQVAVMLDRFLGLIK